MHFVTQVWLYIATSLVLLRVSIHAQYPPQGRDRYRGNPIRVPFNGRGDQNPVIEEELELPGQEVIMHPFAEVLKSRPHFGYSHSPSGYIPAKLHPCEQSSCYPATGNLLIGREAQLSASSTCGLQGQQRYCIVSNLDADRKKCFWCDSRPTTKPNPLLNHNISNIVYKMYPGTRTKSWWQSENGKENVFIQLDLEAEFHFTHLIITFKTFRPAAMLIERSYDFGKSWHVYRYFAHHCEGSFPRINTGSPQNLTDVICESRYSGVAPSKDGEIIYRVLPPTVHIDNPYSEQVQNLLKMTNLRINFTRLHTLGDDLLDTRDDIEEKYYYAISEMVVRGSCSCYGHANRCKPLPGIDSKPDMVHGKCECTHNTKGRNCEKCEDFYNDLPWRPAIGKETHACKRCNCNNHATSCHFDPALYESTGKLSGGVCDGCQHNTQGPNCEQCKPFFFRDPGRDIQDPEVCKLCDCDPHGSLDGGICDSITDPVNNLEAGSCHCKSNVEGRRCDSCKNGFWNFTETNPDGCQACTCNTFGTIDNQGCNQYTGECTCKRYVTGRDCNQCLPEYWGLSEKKDGCQSCDCDPGGSIDNNCDVITGKCRCRDNLMGRTCNTSNQLYYIAALDYFLYEAELSPNTSNCQVVIKEPYRDGRENPWTGTGYLKNFENSYFLTYVNNIPKTTDYNIVIRYEPTLPYVWSEAVVTLIRPEKPDPKNCDRSQIEESQLIPLPPNSRQFVAHSEVCLEAGVPYTIKIEFRKYDTTKETPTASILIDSILLTPVIKKIPWFDGNNLAGLQRFEDFKRHQCDNPDYYLNPKKAPEACKNFYKSISADINNGGLPCQCDGTGSTSNLCNENGGNCTCKPNVVGRRCDRCAVGTYGFGPDGCKSCDCNSIGALDNFCNATTGQCKCRANTYGRECDQCRTGFWNFPNCMRCDCNGHAETCHPTTGECINCKDSTQGHYCHECVVGYYGEPKLNSDIPCRPCPCPGLANSNHSFATNCSLDPYTKDVVCQCHEAYTGPRCDLCSNNYYGNPEVQGGSCQSCDCNDKIDMLSDGNCDPHSGKCLKCLYETTGDHCEVCRANYFRYTKESFCEECNCNGLGTNKTAGFCDPESGQCPCLPNVSGLRCDGCIKDYWKIASGLGCERCDCDPLGSLDSQCNAFDGQCVCKPGFGGRQCSECTSLSWGDPKVECKSCQCNDWGSEHRQCDRKTGACVCRLGIGGYNCDTCARGYLGQFPNCQPCGECFDNWDRILQETRSNTTDLINRASNIKKVGARGAYTKEFDNMQSQLDDIKQLLNNTDTVDVDDINKDLSKLRERINDTEVQRMKLDDKLAETKEKMVLTDINLKKQTEEINELNDKIKNLEKNGTELQADNVQGALNLIQNAQIKATEAEEKAEHTQKAISAAERQCKAAEALVNNTATTFKKSLENNKMKLEGIKNDLERLKGVLPDLNNLVCDGHGDPCDVICGGAGCNSCGNSVSCENGAKQQAEAALSLTNSAEVVLRNKEATANDFIRNISLINTNETRNTAQATYEQAEKAFKKFNLTLHDVDALKNDIQEFLDQNITENIKNITEEGKLILGKKINSLSQDEIDKLANDIKDIVNSLTNTSYIIDATKDDLLKVNKLKDDAANAKDKAAELLNEAKEVKAVLNNSTNKQKEAELAIEKALNDTDTVNQLLNEIDEKTRMAHSKTNTTADDINELADKLKQLESNITNNKIYADRVINESAEILLKAQDTTKNFTSLLDKYGKAKRSLETNNNIVKSLKERSKDLSNRAIQLKVKVDQTKHDMKSEIGDKIDPKALEQKILELNRQIGVHIENIRIKSNHYNNC